MTTPTVEALRANRNRIQATRYRKRRALDELRGVPVGPVDAAPIRMHLKQLLELHWGAPAIIAATGAEVTSTGLLLLANGNTVRANRKFLRVLTLPLTLRVPDQVEDHMWVPSMGAARRVQALMALGWRHEDITEMIGGRSSHHLAAARHKVINAHDWRLVDAAYSTMSATPGPSPRSKARAEKQGYAPPLAWDNIDDPAARPHGTRRDRHRSPDYIDPVTVDRVLAGDVSVPASRAEREVIARRWVEEGHGSAKELERLTGWAVHRYYRARDHRDEVA